VEIKEAIKEVLRTAPDASMPPDELKKTCLKRGLVHSSQSYHRHVSSLVESGEIRRVHRYELVEERRPAVDPQRVRDCLEGLLTTSEVVRIVYAEEFEELSKCDKFEYEPGVLVAAGKLLEDGCEDVRVASLMSLVNVAERTRDDRILKRMSDDNLQKLRQIALQDPSIGCRQHAIILLGKLGNGHALGTLLEIVKKGDDRAYSQLRYVLEKALTNPDSTLVKRHEKDVRRQLLCLFADPSVEEKMREAVAQRTRGLLRTLRNSKRTRSVR